MANIIKITKENSYGRRKNSIVDVKCIYEFGQLQDGRSCVILKTYNPNSQKKGISQTLHITRETAQELIGIFKQELNI